MDQIDALLTRLEAPDASASPTALDTAFAGFRENARLALDAKPWTTPAAAGRDVRSLLEGLADALEPLSRVRATLDELEEEEKPPKAELEAGLELASTPEEKDDANPFSGVLGRLSTPKKEQPSPAQPLPAPRQSSSPHASSSRNSSPSTSSHSPQPKPRLPAPAAAVILPHFDPLDVPLATYPAVPVPAALLSPDTGKPVFLGGFIRQRGGRIIRGHTSWTDIGGDNCKTLSDGRLCYKNLAIAPSAPGYLSYYGKYLEAARLSITGTQLGQLGDEAKKRWLKTFSLFGKKRENKLTQWGVPNPKPLTTPSAIWDAVVAGGDSVVVPYTVFACTGFDIPLVQGWVAKRAERWRLEAGPVPVLEAVVGAAAPKKRAAPKDKAAGQPSAKRQKGGSS
ncbi:hypothetical protein JCM10207_008755 [Rhodosporidiobolus poonsookiae]